MMNKRSFRVTESFRKPTLFVVAAGMVEVKASVFDVFRFNAASGMISWIGGTWYMMPLLRFRFF